MSFSLNPEDQQRALRWAEDHHAHVVKLWAKHQGVFPPSPEDAAQPTLWKPAHWVWFFNTTHKNDFGEDVLYFFQGIRLEGAFA